MIDKSILQENLNSKVSYRDFFNALGYADNDTVYLRTFDDRAKDSFGMNKEVNLSRIDSIMPSLHKENTQNRGVFFVVNGAGQKDEDVLRGKVAKAQFVDFDEFPFEEQIEKINSFPLEPSIIIKTRRSLHCYWLLKDGEAKYFRQLQVCLNALFQSDPKIKNESRVMRLYGFNHCKEEPIEIKLIKFDPNIRYTQRDFVPHIPNVTEESTRQQVQRVDNGELIPQGQRHDYMKSLAGAMVAKNYNIMSADAMVSALMVMSDERLSQDPPYDRNHLQKDVENMVQNFIAKHRAEVETAAEQDWSYNMSAWRAEHQGEAEPSVIPWDEVRRAGERQRDKDSKYQEMKSAAQSEPKQEQELKQSEETLTEEEKAQRAEKIREELSKESTLADMDGFFKYISSNDERRVIPSGFTDIDKIMQGGFMAELCIIGAISSLGKTTFITQLADNIAKQGRDVLFYSLEMRKYELIAKSISRLSYQKSLEQTGTKKYAKTALSMLKGTEYWNYSKEERFTVDSAIKEYKKYAGNIYIIEGTGDVGVSTIKDRIDRHITATGKAPIVIVDYVQILKPLDYRMSDKQAVDENINALSAMSKEYDIPIIGISSFNRASYTEPVSLTSFKESGAVEYRSDILIALQYNEMDYKENESEKDRDKRVRTLIKEQEELGRIGEAQTIQVKVLKQRKATKGETLLKFYPSFCCFEDDRDYKSKSETSERRRF